MTGVNCSKSVLSNGLVKNNAFTKKKLGNFVYVIHCLLTIGMFECMSDACYFHLTVNLAGLALTAIQAGDNTEESEDWVHGNQMTKYSCFVELF